MFPNLVIIDGQYYFKKLKFVSSIKHGVVRSRQHLIDHLNIVDTDYKFSWGGPCNHDLNVSYMGNKPSCVETINMLWPFSNMVELFRSLDLAFKPQAYKEITLCDNKIVLNN